MSREPTLKWMKTTARVIGAILAAYLVVRGIAEFFVIDLGDPSTYHLDWGGPSLLGVLAVHTGPAVVILGYCAYSANRASRSRRGRSAR